MKQVLTIIIVAFFMLSAAKEESKKANVHVVRIEGMKFIPRSLEVRVGETVRWINQSGSSHNVVANDGSFKSNMLDDKGDQFEFTFNTEGEYHYYCQPHRMMGMKGVLIVRK